jgi:outer membrane protein assembly factor BamB
LTAFDAATGDVKWTGSKGGKLGPYGSPVLMTVDGTKLIVTPTQDSLVGVSLADGKELWQEKLPGQGYSVNFGTPIVDGQTVIYDVTGAKGSGGSSLALKIDKKGEGFTATELWKSTGSYQYNTPVLKDGLLFGLTSGKKNFYCMDAKTGKVLWTDETPRGEAGGIVSAGSVILAVTGPAAAERKDTTAGDAEFVVFEASGTGYKELAKYKLSPGTGLSYPIVAGKRLYVKGNDAVTLWMID